MAEKVAENQSPLEKNIKKLKYMQTLISEKINFEMCSYVCEKMCSVN